MGATDTTEESTGLNSIHDHTIDSTNTNNNMSHTIIDDGSGIKVAVLDDSDFKYPSVSIALIKDAINKLSVNNKPIDLSY